MVSVVPSIIPILTANAVAANQSKKQKKANVSKEKKLKDSPLNSKINCRIFLNNGKVIEGHYEGNWYEDNSDEEGIWIKTDNGIEEINSKDYDRVEYYHKKTVKESFFNKEIRNILRIAGVKLNERETINESVIRNDDNEICGYYTRRSRELLNIIDSKYKENDIRVIYDIDRNLYIFADTYSVIHFNLMLYMILFTNVYDNIPEIKNNKYESDEVLQDIIKSKLYFSSFKIFRNYTNDSDEEFIRFLKNTPENSTDGYAYGYVCKINDKLWAICRDDEIGEALQVPLLKNKKWINLSKNTQLNEEMIHAEKSFYDGDDFAYVLKNPTKNELKGYGLTRTRFICFNDETWLFFDPMQWIHAHIWNKYKDKFGGSTNMGFYDLSNNEFIFIEPMDYDEGEEGYEEEFNYYIDKEQKFLLSYPYIVNTFGKNFNIMVYGDWVDNPW